MHNLNEKVYSEGELRPQVSPDHAASPNVQPLAGYQWEQPQWQPYAPPVLWDTPSDSYNFNVRPMVASAPTTPNMVPYHGEKFPFFYVFNFHRN